MRLFHKAGDYEAFEQVLAEGLERYSVELLTYCVMPNHWHLVVRLGGDKALGLFMGWVGVTHVRRHHEHYHSRGGGHLYQGRFKSFPVAEDDCFLALCRYVEANPLRASLVERAEQWQWSGLWRRLHGSSELRLSAWPLERRRNWVAWINRDLNDEHLEGSSTTGLCRCRAGCLCSACRFFRIPISCGVIVVYFDGMQANFRSPTREQAKLVGLYCVLHC